jgi:hypothetical protein
MPHRGAKGFYDIMDTLVALQLEYASGTEGESAISALGPAKEYWRCEPRWTRPSTA